MPDINFYEQQSQLSKVKSKIVSRYFEIWAKIIVLTQQNYPQHKQKLAYIDLFAGPGRYIDGSQSTPIMVLEKSIQDENIREKLVTLFNDKNEDNTKSLEQSISQLDGIHTMQFAPQIMNEEIGTGIVNRFEEMRLIPTLFFIDPWGYKGLSLRLINSALKDWGCECIFFFNYNRISAGIMNPRVKTHMDTLFGEARARVMRSTLNKMELYQKEPYIIQQLHESINSYGERYFLSFRFVNGNRTSHHLIFVSKNFLGYEKMKEIMADESSKNIDGVPSMEFNPADFSPQQSLPFQLSYPIDDLGVDLQHTFRGQKLTMFEVYKRHCLNTPYIKNNYKDALKKLLKKGIITARNSQGKPPRKGTFGDDIIVTLSE